MADCPVSSGSPSSFHADNHRAEALNPLDDLAVNRNRRVAASLFGAAQSVMRHSQVNLLKHRDCPKSHCSSLANATRGPVSTMTRFIEFPR